MNNNIPLFRYIVGDSKIHKMSSKYKIASFLLSIIIIIGVKDLISASLFALLIIFLMAETKIKLDQYVKNILVIWPVYLLITGLAFVITFDMSVGLLALYKSIMFVITILILTYTTSLSEIAWGFECLFEKLKKIKIPVSKIALNLALGIKFISTVFEQGKAIRKSMAYRGVPYNKKHKTIKNMVLPVVSLSMKLSKRMVAAMKLRFYGYASTRTNYRGNKVTKFDKVIIFLQFAIIYLVIWLGWFR